MYWRFIVISSDVPSPGGISIIIGPCTFIRWAPQLTKLVSISKENLSVCVSFPTNIHLNLLFSSLQWIDEKKGKRQRTILLRIVTDTKETKVSLLDIAS